MATYAVAKISNSAEIVLPEEICETPYESNGADVECGGAKVTIAPANERPTLESLICGYNGPKSEFIDPGQPTGEEL